MNSLLSKRLPGILALGLVTLAVGAAGSPASAATSEGAHISALTKAQKKAKAKALKACNKKKSAKQRRACKVRVNKKFKRLAVPKGKTVLVNLFDNYFTPTSVNLKVNDSIKWSWANVGNREAHNVTLAVGPAGVRANDFTSETTTATSTRFTRKFAKPGAYDFLCTLHTQMTMKVNVSR